MASRLIVAGALLCFACMQLPRLAAAGGLDERGEAQAKEGSRLYKQGKYEDAAQIFAKLSVEYPDMAIFERNVGACFYYLRRPEPALSNLRRYLSRKKNIAPDDKAVVDRWIDEMERLRTQNTDSVPQPVMPPAAAPLPSKADESAPPPAAAAAEAPNGEDLPVHAEATPPVEPSPLDTSAAPTRQETASKPAGLDLAVVPASGETGQKKVPYYKRWWFWGGIGAAVAAGAVTAVILSTRGAESNIPGSALGNQGAFQ